MSTQQEINIYIENGYESRKHYLKCLSEDYGVPFATVVTLAQMLGSSEDFDSLVSSLEDAEEMYGEEW